MDSWTAADADLDTSQRLQAALSAANERLRVYERIKTIPSHVIPAYKSAGGDAWAVAMLSDTHWEERVDPADVPGSYNVYTPAIAKMRAAQFAQRVVLLTDSLRNLAKVENLCLAVLGDLITGHLHDDNRESNWMSPLPAILFAMDQVNSILEYLVQHGNFKRIVVPCCYGNHGRTTHKPRAKTAPQTNLEWMLYQLLAKHWDGHPTVQFHVADGAMIYVDLGKTCVRFMHGDHVNFQGGIGGLCVPLLKAVHKWDQTKKADLTCLGHFHQASDFGHVVVNGSMIGYNAYAVTKAIPYERPKQQYILIDNNRGKSLVCDIFCDYLPKKGTP